MLLANNVCGENTVAHTEVSGSNEKKFAEPNLEESARGQNYPDQASNFSNASSLINSDEEILGEEALVHYIHGQSTSRETVSQNEQNFRSENTLADTNHSQGINSYPASISSRDSYLQALLSILTVRLCLIDNYHIQKSAGSGSLLNPHTWVHFSKLLQLNQLQCSAQSFTAQLLVKVNQKFIAIGQISPNALYEISFGNLDGRGDIKIRRCSKGFHEFGEYTFLAFQVHISLCEYLYSKYQDLCAFIQNIPEVNNNIMTENTFFLIGHNNGDVKKIYPGHLRDASKIIPPDYQYLSIEENACQFLMRTMALSETECVALLAKLFPGDMSILATRVGIYLQDMKRIYQVRCS